MIPWRLWLDKNDDMSLRLYESANSVIDTCDEQA